MEPRETNEQVNADMSPEEPTEEATQTSGSPAGPRPEEQEQGQNVDFDTQDITTDDLEGGGEEVTPATQDPRSDQAAGGILGAAQAIAEQIQRDLESDVEDASMTQREILQQLSQSFEKISQRGDRTQELSEEAGIPGLSEDLTEINNDLLQTRREFQNEKRVIQEAAGLTLNQKNARISEIERKEASQMADLSIQAQVAQNRFDSAQSLVDRKVELEFGDEEAKIDALKFFFEENKDILTTKEQRLYQERVAEREQKTQKARDEYERLENTKLELMARARQNGAPREVISSIQTAQDLDTAFNVAGEFGVDMTERAALQTERLRQQNIRSQIAERGQDATDLQTFQEDGVTYTFNPATGETQRSIGGEDQTAEEVAQREQNQRQVMQDIERVNSMLSNEAGLGASAGALRSGFFESFGRFGGPARIPETINQKNNFLAEAGYIINNLTFEKLQDLKAGGATFGALSDSELRAIGSASNELAGMAIEDEQGNLQGFRGSEQKVKDNLLRIQENYARALDKANVDALDDDEFQEIMNIQ